jgi:hypothetical protein
MQDHASAIFQRDELSYREALRTLFVEALRPEIADRAKAYDATRLDRERIRVIVNAVRVRVPSTLHTDYLPLRSARDRLWYALSQPRTPTPALA